MNETNIIEQNYNFSLALKDLPHIFPEKARKSFAKLGIETLRDLLSHLPSRYENRSRITPIADLEHGKMEQICAKIHKSSQQFSGRRRMLIADVVDDAGDMCKLVFFNLYPSQTLQFKSGRRGVFYGKAQQSHYGYFSLAHPEISWLEGDNPPEIASELYAIYPTSKSLSQAQWRASISAVLEGFSSDNFDPLTQAGFLPLKTELETLHRPSLLHKESDFALARNRLAIEEICAHRIAMLEARNYLQSFAALELNSCGELYQQLLRDLPFSLTSAQERVRQEIAQDLSRNIPMLRLVQGDVGSGKTLIALLACLSAVDSGAQAVFMAPTELLAEQHANNIKRFCANLPLSVLLLTSKKNTKEKREILEQIADGRGQIIIGTHALFQDKVLYHNLGLIVIDEQHRFGVGQRLKLQEKTAAGMGVHQLVLTATPIPRTLAMSSYGELDTSIIDELPAGRSPVRTSIISNSKRDILIKRIREQCAKHTQVYWVCPIIEESEVLECENAENIYFYLQEQMPELKIELLHGRVEAKKRREVMADFAAGKIDLLVATTVIEVGVDVPNASLMIIENSERFGLSQLHQLRGRVGRGAKQSDCVLMYQEPLGQIAKRRLQIMRETNDGFRIAEEDLSIRGAGELLGTQQTGAAGFLVADIIQDNALLTLAEKLVNTWMQSENTFCQELLERWAQGKEKFLQV